jgi:xanthine dehydrogenase iron-sulfur cluster and FAD-binding subunit A
LAELPGLPHFAAPEQSLGMVDPSAPGGRARQHISETCPVDGVDFIREEDDRVVIVALTTIRGIEVSPLVTEKVPLLAQTAGLLGSVQVRHRATIGGNLGVL